MRENLKGHFVTHWSLKRDLKGKCVTLTIEGKTQRTMIHIEHWGAISKDKYTLTIEWEFQRMLLHVHTNIWWGISKNVVTLTIRGNLGCWYRYWGVILHTFLHMNIGDGSQQVNLCTHTQVPWFWVLTSWPLGVRVGHWTSVYSADWLQMSQPS